MFQPTVNHNDGTSAMLMGNGDPNVNSVTPPVGIDNATYTNTWNDARDLTPVSWIWNKDNGNWDARS